MNHTLRIGDFNLPCREVVVDEQTFLAPRGVARNNRNKSWQIKINRDGKLALSGNFTDAQYGGTAGALEHAIQCIADSGQVEAPRTIKLSNRVSLVWAYSGPGVLGMTAMIYNPDIKRQTAIYLISHSKLAAGKTDGLKKKLMRVFAQEWREVNNATDVPVPALIKMDRNIDKLLTDKSWEDFMRVGAEVSSAYKA